MSSSEQIFALRLVIADFYMEKPVPGLDTCYSEFRGKEIKRVPVIRIFGSNAEGQKTCMHVHGVFPYFYIPYDQKDFQSLNQAIYQVALNLDKAINISLSQGSSSSQHVFKVQLVKGIPFYGYHRCDHQFLKIYMFNPRFVRRAANLLQNGAILNNNFHPHESHVPYILQFMIDYNLYGMSFLHVPLEIVKFRRSVSSEEIPYKNLQESQILDINVAKKISCSALEVDVGSNFILNRFQIIAKTNATHTNPGIESIWHDERLRRQKLAQYDDQHLNTIPALEVPSTQQRSNVEPTESEIFHRTALLSKLLTMETSMSESTQISDETITPSNNSNATFNLNNLSLNKKQKRTFNLSKILENFVYPEECTQSDNIINASFIPNHLSNNNVFEQSFLISSNEAKDQHEQNELIDDSVFMDETIVDEELVLSLTQRQHHKMEQQKHHVPLNATLRDEDIELLDVLQELEENNEDKIDLDSSLAPLSQNHKNFTLTPKELDKETTCAALQQSTAESDSEEDAESDENLHDFSIALENLDDLILKLTQSQAEPNSPNKNFHKHMPQVDGANDMLKTPTKSAKKSTEKSLPRTPTTPKNRRLTMGSPGRSPKSPKTCHKYAPLPLVSVNRSANKSVNDSSLNQISPPKRTPVDRNCLPMFSLQKKGALSDLRLKSISVDKDLEEHVTALKESTSRRRHSKRLVDLDKTHVTCALTPRKTSKKLLKVYRVESNDNKVLKGNGDLTNESKEVVESSQNKKQDISNVLRSKRTVANGDNFGNKSVEIKTKKAEISTTAKSSQKEFHNCVNNLTTKILKANFDSEQEQESLRTSEINDNKELKINLNNIDIKETKCPKMVTSNTETDEEIIDSDSNADNRLRRSFIATNSAKRRRITRKLTLNRTESFTKESSFKCKYNIEDKINNSHFQLKKCKVKLKRIEKSLRRATTTVKSKGVGKIIECGLEKWKNQNKAAIFSLESCENSTEGMLANNVASDEISGLEKQRFLSNLETVENAMASKEFAKTGYPTAANALSSAILARSKTRPIEIPTRIERLERKDTKEQQNLLQNLENVQNSLKLNLQPQNCTTANENFTKTLSLDINKEISDEEITETPPQESDNSLRLTHIYNKSLSLQSPILFTQNSSPILLANTGLKNSKAPSRTNSIQSESCITLTSSSSHSGMTPGAKLVLTPLDLPPSREEVLKGCRKLQLPEYEFQKPFYSNPDDITKHKELGFTLLQIPGNKLNDIEEFQSILGTDFKGLTAWRRDQLIQLGGMEMLNKYRNTQRVREYFCNRNTVIMAPQFNAPTRQEVKLWLKARVLLKKQGEDLEEIKTKNLEEDSPIKIRRQKVTMMLNTETGNVSDDDNNSLGCTSRSLTLTPLTPATPKRKESKINEDLKDNFTPVTRHIEKINLKRDMSLTKRTNCRVLRRVSLNKQLKEAFEKESKQSYQEKTSINEEALPYSHSSSEISVTSEMAIAELERSSFMRHLKETDITVAGFTDNSTLNSSFGFKLALENLQQAKADVEFNYLTIIVLEVFVVTRDDLYPNPELDEIRCLFYAIENSIHNDPVDAGQNLPQKACGYIMVHDYRDAVAQEGRIHGIDLDIEVTIVQTEVQALEALLNLCSRWDPDIYAGYEIEMSSWGFVMERAKYLCLNIAPLLSRVPSQKARDYVDEERESFTDLDVEMKLCGRILLDVWRLLRSEIALTSYTFENVMYHIMHKRCPWHSYRSLTEWFAAPCSRWIVIEYYLERVRGTLALLDQLDLIGRTSEMAKLIGIQFYEVLSRGSQFRVESMMLRIAKPKNLVPLSPSVQQRAHMRAPEYLALIMEPQSRFYADPLIVLDFQSLYPSMIIAYNYCFSTCLGRVEHLGQSTPFEFGASQLRVSPGMLRELIDRDLITISPCGVVFVKSSVREGILPRMLKEILDTRQMVKQSMKLHKSNSALQRILHSRQLGLKLMANVTYGYTAANFSGRMPAVEVGDSVVSKGRETLERAIKLVEANDKWNVKVVYGDTDSMFVLVPGRNRDAAFRIGEEIAEAVTEQNPHPVKLKLEKVYQPCILQTKKRYVGYMYETSDQKEPVYEAKGIETVRRDGCPAVAKMLEKVLRILFESADVTRVKQYVLRQFTKILSGQVNLQDLIFAKEFRGLNGYRPTACVPALELTRKWIQTDPRRVPRRGERVPFIIINGPPGVPLIRLVRHPHQVLAEEGLKINAIYYITKAIIPPLNRCLLLIGADVNEWFANLPRKLLLTPAFSTANEISSCPNNTTKSKKSTISQFFSTTNCIVDCGRQTKQGICSECSQSSTRSVVILQTKISKIERSYHTTQHICQACCGRVGDIQCGSLDCPVLYVLEVKRRDLQQIMHFRNLVEERF